MDKLHQARTAARVGDLAEARRLLVAATEETPENPEIWLELAGVAESLEEKKACLEKVSRPPSRRHCTVIAILR
jgi:thioredoxin-like negative regulator of GroEL